MSNELWINKYKPTTIHNITGNQNQINKIIDWLNNLDTYSYSLIITGNQGIGKTHIIKLILEEFKYKVHIINPNDIKDHRILDDINDYYNHKNSIYSKIKLNNEDVKQIVLIFEEIENITLTSEKKYIMDIFKENNKKKCFPLVFISNNQHSKLLNDLKKNCTEILFNTPIKKDLIVLINNICNKENIKIHDDNSIDILIDFSQNDIRRLINLLQEYSYNFNELKEEYILNFIDNSKKKNIDIGLFDATNNILNDYLDYNTILKLYENEKVLLPLMIQENYINKVLNKSTDDWNDVLSNLVKISDSISIGDNIETNIYTDQNWYLQNIHVFYTCINSSYLINCYNKNNKINKSNFSSDLNKTSLKNINRKNITNFLNIIPNKSIYEILMLNRICNNFINNNNEKYIIDLLSSYNKDITIKEIELSLKIDKTSDFKLLCSKQKKKILKILKKYSSINN